MRFVYCCLLAFLLFAAGCITSEEEKYVAETHPLYTTNSPGTKFALLPSAVQRTITSQAGSADIRDINKVAGSNREVYEIKFANPGVSPNLYIAEDGTLVSEGSVRSITSIRSNPTATTTTATATTARPPPTIVAGGAPGSLGGSETGGNASGLSVVAGLPEPVKRTLIQTSPNSVVVDVQPSTHTLYKFDFKDPGLNPRTVISDDGTLYRELSTP
ncbi:hypothetical protein [Pedosphaera parvula]|uniref:Beta-lactamase-inhibitor-like PepSY-like domain-containing protein n=1 Tax=Pedosphaera parvula (strain Ellin514) TaxID=320771 RepID=B9XC87_PEDPL|nr:hypothetical protein [Pedosphaera parvula]EEF62555.1 hypothetical protein Cflav_PD5190 [Pedosphaera parvula Ellin514]